MEIWDSKKGIAFIWFGILVILLIWILFYTVLDQPVQKIKNMTIINVTGSQYESSYHKQNTIWDYLPWIFLLFVLLFGIIEAMRRKQYE